MIFAFIDKSCFPVGNQIHAGIVCGLTDADIYWNLDATGHDPYDCVLKPIIAGCVSVPADITKTSEQIVFVSPSDAFSETDRLTLSELLTDTLSFMSCEPFDNEFKIFENRAIRPLTYNEHCEFQSEMMNCALLVDDETIQETKVGE